VQKFPERGIADVQFAISEGAQEIIEEIVVTGNLQTLTRFIRREVKLEPGDPVDYGRINEARRRLYDTRLFRFVEMDVQPLSDHRRYRLTIRVTENPPWRVRYGFAVTDHLTVSDRDLGGVAEFSYANVLGKGILVGSALKYNAAEHEARLFGTLPRLFGEDLKTDISIFKFRDLSVDRSITDTSGITFLQQARFGKAYVLSYDYTFRNNRVFARSESNTAKGPGERVRTARLNATLTRDTRDDILNSTSGSFFSNSFELAPPGIGSSVQFTKDLFQAFYFRPWRNMIWASGLRIGMAGPFGNRQLIDIERFRAGGSTTVRGFKQNKLAQTPGNALFVANQELRFPLFWRFAGVGFVDAGNVFESASQWNPLKSRIGAGFGLRIRTPFVLTRVDFGVNVNPRPGEDRFRVHVGIGQAF